ncbi:hypothetical protein ATANTOWER_022918 [Ataeniobius toweri]|uniref:Uncharacterized protein n=1 Tax=Ataeniobius toweri TaxID=208326 RepID=A0ABU7BS09_9TELE|nr:hypothetical protein [Ataeniobius toweri]
MVSKYFLAECLRLLKINFKNIYMENDEAAKRETGHRGTCTKGHKQSRSSLESIYSLKSGQSSSSKLIHAKVCSL